MRLCKMSIFTAELQIAGSINFNFACEAICSQQKAFEILKTNLVHLKFSIRFDAN